MIMSVGIVIGTLITFAVITEIIYSQTVFDAVDQNLLTHKNMILNDAHVQYEGNEVSKVTLPAPLVKELINYIWKDGVLIKDSPHAYKGSKTYPSFPDINEIKGQQIITIKDNGYHYRGIQFMLEGCKVQLLLRVDDEINSLYNLKRALLIALLILLIVALVLAFYLAKLALKPLYKTYHKQARFIQDASHEMRTPLAVIRGKMELLARRSQDPIDEHFDELASMMSEIRSLEKMNKDLLMISKEDMQGILDVRPLEIQNLFSDIVELYKELAMLQGLEFVYEGLQEDVTVYWDRDKIKRCINILLENAIKYSNHQGRVTLSVQKQDKVIIIQVSDTGKGIKEEDMPHIFERFYRSDEIRGSGIEGSGIGLSLLKSLCYTMGIKIKVSSKYQKGSTFHLQVPIKMIK